MLRVGLTGGIGSGKSTVAKYFEDLGIPVFYADEESKSLLDTDPILKKELTTLLGDELYKEGTLDRAWMAARVFNDEDLLHKVNSIIHPRVAMGFYIMV